MFTDEIMFTIKEMKCITGTKVDTRANSLLKISKQLPHITQSLINRNKMTKPRKLS